MPDHHPEILLKFQKQLDPYIKPREQVNYIRRVLALHLGTCAGNGAIQSPLFLIDSSQEVTTPSDLTGVFREYVEALQANTAARRQFDSLLKNNTPEDPEPPNPKANSVDLLEERICLLKLRQKRESLLAARQSLDLIMEKPAATREFLDAKHIFQGSPGVPSAPDDVINSLALDQTSPQSGLSDRIQQLEKTVLRAKLLLKQEEQTVQETRARSKNQFDMVSNGARMEALTTTRNELITWIETELAKASPGGSTGAAKSGNHKSRVSPSTIAANLEEISKKYAKYVSSRKTLLDLETQQFQLSQPSHPSLLPPAQLVAGLDRSSNKPPMPIDHLLTPYLRALAAISVSQKAAISQKAFFTSALSKQNQDACQLLGRLGEESHLLPSYPMKDSLRRRSGIQTEIASKSEHPDISKRIKPWVFAADSAKIALLEYAAETVDIGQVALENCLENLREIDFLLGHPEEGEDSSEVSERQPKTGAAATRLGSRKHTSKNSITDDGHDVWSRLHGNLGVLRDAV
ncbi:hypothetical protein T069G_00754 [Trichoderma breve]|uniref:Uncharacterized protein n=1 Tax=Trichoderma breve TaxID=2034170 RepID=A0A9W9JQK9_9HYPO|nr:hypothetical protein T069G_00754 [Trichoderma breve]KAJ4864224.1 hypothetical protein T069G_00754 [Trichoderma breve]